MEEQLIPREGFPLHTLSVLPFKGQSRLAQLQALAAFGGGTWQAVRVLRRQRPHLVIGSGGYVMGPAMLAAAMLRRPRVMMEQNVVPGLTVRTMARFAQVVFTAFPETQGYLPGRCVECTGIPIRQDICDGMTNATAIGDDVLHLMVVGGSQGAHRINQAMVEAVPFFKELQGRIRVVHQTGEADFVEVECAYREAALEIDVQPFLYDIAARYHWAHLVVCRAGASTLAELTACGKPAMLVPYPYAADNHQYHNAMVLQRHGAAQVILDAELTGVRLTEAVRPWVGHAAGLGPQAERSRQLGNPHAADAIVSSCLRLLGEATD